MIELIWDRRRPSYLALYGLILHGGPISAIKEFLEHLPMVWSRNQETNVYTAAILQAQPMDSLQIFETLHEARVPIDHGPTNQSPLRAAVVKHLSGVVEWLLKHGANPFVVGSNHYNDPTLLYTYDRDRTLLWNYKNRWRIKVLCVPSRLRQVVPQNSVKRAHSNTIWDNQVLSIILEYLNK